MKARIVRALVRKEAQRYWHNRPSLVLAVLLVLVSVLTSVGGRGGPLDPQGLPSCCYLLYWREDEFVRHLRTHPPAGGTLRVVHADDMIGPSGTIEYPGDLRRLNIVSIQLRLTNPAGADSGFAPAAPPPNEPPRYYVWYWYPPERAEALLPYRSWFNAELRRYFGSTPAVVEAETVLSTETGPILPIDRVVTALVAAAVYLFCFHLNIMITSEERERKTLLAQMLTPASVGDVLAAKALFYMPATLALASIVLTANRPAALAQPLLWAALLGASVGYLSIGLVICSVSRTQSSAGLTALAYFLIVGVTSYLGAITPVFDVLRLLLLDYYFLQLIHFSMLERPPAYAPLLVGGLAVLAAAWAVLAVRLFRRRAMR